MMSDTHWPHACCCQSERSPTHLYGKDKSPVGNNNPQILTQRQQQCTGKIGRPLSQRCYRSLPLIHEDTLQVARLWSAFESLRHIFRMKIWTSTWRKIHPFLLTELRQVSTTKLCRLGFDIPQDIQVLCKINSCYKCACVWAQVEYSGMFRHTVLHACSACGVYWCGMLHTHPMNSLLVAAALLASKLTVPCTSVLL